MGANFPYQNRGSHVLEDKETRRKLELRGKIEAGCSAIPETPQFTPSTSYFTSTLRDSRVWSLSLSDW